MQKTPQNELHCGIGEKSEWETFGPHVPSFAEAAKASREVLLEFAEDRDTITEKHASAMHVYMNKKFSVSPTVSYEHFVTFQFMHSSCYPL